MNIDWTNIQQYRVLSGDIHLQGLPPLTVLTGRNGVGKSVFLESLFEPNCSRLGAQGLSWPKLEGLTSGPQIYVRPNTSLSGARARVGEGLTEGPITEALRRKAETRAEAAGVSIVDDDHEFFGIDRLLISSSHGGLNPSSLASVFLEYYRRLCMLSVSLGEKAKAEIRLGTPPWLEFSALIQSVGLDYQVKPPCDLDSYELFLNKDNQEIPLAYLSSGEQRLMMLALWYFSLKQAGDVPSLILLDEFDSHLHPSLISTMFTLLNDEFVRHGTKVVLATHRPDTIALAPKDSVYLMTKQPTQIERVSQSEALQVIADCFLLCNIKTVNVLVEDNDDQKFYEDVFKILVRSRQWTSGINLKFISVKKANVGKEDGGGCSLVRKKLEVLRGIDEQTGEYVLPVVGLIDRDVSNVAAQDLFVLDRYSIENFLCDPLVIYCQLLKKEQAPDVGLLNLLGCGDYALVRRLDSVEKQKIVTAITQKLAAHKSIDTTDSRLEQVQYLDGSKVNIPSWFFSTRGHDLIRAVEEIFGKSVHRGSLNKAFKELALLPESLKLLYEEISSF